MDGFLECIIRHLSRSDLFCERAWAISAREFFLQGSAAYQDFFFPHISASLRSSVLVDSWYLVLIQIDVTTLRPGTQ